MAFWPASAKLWIANQCGLAWSPRRPPWPKKGAYEPSDSARFGTAFAEMANNTIKLVTTEDGSIKHPGIGATPLDVAPYAERNKLTEGAALKLAATHRNYIEELNHYLEQNLYAAIWGEQAIVVDIYKGTARLAMSDDESFKPPPGCMSAKLDMVAARRYGDSSRLIVRDDKTGWGSLEAPPEKNWQLRFNGLAASRLHGATTVQIELARHFDDRKTQIQVGRFDDDVPWMDAFEIEVVLADVKQLLARIETTTAPCPGPACSKCPVVATCPTTLDTLARVKETGDAADPFWATGELSGPEHAAVVKRRVDMLEAATKRYKQQIAWYAKEVGGFKTDDRHFYGPVEAQGDRAIDLKSAKAREIFKKHIKQDVMYLAVSEKASFEGIKKALSAQGDEPGEGKGSKYSQIIAELTEIGAISRGASYTKIDEYLIKEPKKKTSDKQAAMFGEGDE